MKTKVVVAIGLMLVGGSSMAAPETIEAALAKCSKQSNSLQRLVCYDKLVKELNQYEGVNKAVTRDRVAAQAVKPPASGKPQTVIPAPARQNADDAETDFGMEHKQDVSDKADSMTATITDLRETVTGKYIVTLSNGTVWQQTDSNRLKIKAGQSVMVERGLLGAFYLSRPDLNSRLKVKRIK